MSTSYARLLLAFALGTLTAVIVVLGVLVATDVIGADEPEPEPVTATADTTSEASSPAAPRTAPTSVAEIYEQVSSGVVFITAAGVSQPDGFPPQGGGGTATGSGFLIDDEGFIVTNDHVVGGANDITVRFGDGDPVEAELRGRDPSSDLALLQVDSGAIPEEVDPVPLGSSEDLRPGDAAIAIGSPFGLAGTITTGIISALDREILAPNGFTISGVLQTDAAINPGNSGGPLLDARGRAIGVNSQIATGAGSAQSSGVGFAVPIDTVQRVIPALRRGEVVERAWLGVSTGSYPGADGIVVGRVIEGGPADEAGVLPGDVVVSVGDEPVRDPADIGAAVNERDPGDELELELRRDGETETITVTLGERPQQEP